MILSESAQYMNNWRLRQTIFFLLKVKFDLLTAAIGLLSAYITLKYAQNIQLGFTVSAFIIFFSLIIIIWLRLRDQTFYFLPLRSKKYEAEWIGNGIFKYRKTQDAFLITNSEAGFIYSKSLSWVDHSLEFNFKIIETCLGVILKATNLSNYVMLQITESGIRPHIRINGGWRVWEPKESGLEFTEPLSRDSWYKCVLLTESEAIVIKIFKNGKTILNREWHIPKGSVSFLFKKNDTDEGIEIPFPINLEYGSFGFRSSHNEKGLIRDILVKKI